MTGREEFLETISEIAADIADAVVEDPVDHKKLAELTALGVQACLVGVGTLLEESPTNGEPEKLPLPKDIDLQQLFSFEGGSK